MYGIRLYANNPEHRKFIKNLQGVQCGVTRNVQFVGTASLDSEYRFMVTVNFYAGEKNEGFGRLPVFSCSAYDSVLFELHNLPQHIETMLLNRDLALWKDVQPEILETYIDFMEAWQEVWKLD